MTEQIYTADNEASYMTQHPLLPATVYSNGDSRYCLHTLIYLQLS